MQIIFLDRSDMKTPTTAIHFINDKGDILSVIKNKYAYCDDNSYEVWDKSHDDEPMGYVTPEKLTELIE